MRMHHISIFISLHLELLSHEHVLQDICRWRIFKRTFGVETSEWWRHSKMKFKKKKSNVSISLMLGRPVKFRSRPFLRSWVYRSTTVSNTWLILNLYYNSNIWDNIEAMAFKLCMTVDLCMTFYAHAYSDDLDLENICKGPLFLFYLLFVTCLVWILWFLPLRLSAPSICSLPAQS